MRRLIAMITAVAVSVVSAAAVGTATTAQAAGPPIENLAPTNGASLPVGTFVPTVLRFTCPSYESGAVFPQTHDYREYRWRLTTKPAVETNGLLALENLAAEGTALPAGNNECAATTGEAPRPLPRGTYYFQVSRFNSDAPSLYETGPITSFSVGLPATPPGKVTAYLGCGLTRTTKRAGACEPGEKIGAFYKSANASIYEICVRFPSTRLKCKPGEEAKAGVLYVNRVTETQPGVVLVTWKVLRGPTITRHIVRKPPR